jgi:hypothetical protein
VGAIPDHAPVVSAPNGPPLEARKSSPHTLTPGGRALLSLTRPDALMAHVRIRQGCYGSRASTRLTSWERPRPTRRQSRSNAFSRSGRLAAKLTSPGYGCPASNACCSRVLEERARSYSEAARAPATLRACAADWRAFAAWCAARSVAGNFAYRCALPHRCRRPADNAAPKARRDRPYALDGRSRLAHLLLRRASHVRRDLPGTRDRAVAQDGVAGRRAPFCPPDLSRP